MTNKGRPKGSKNNVQRIMPHDKSGLTSYKRLYHANGYRAKKLDFEIFIKLVKLDCYYCGSTAKLTNPNGSIYKEFNNKGIHMSYEFWKDSWVVYNGIDKKEHKEDYSDIDNLVTCCKICNFLKQRLSCDDFILHVKKIAEYQSNKITILS